MFDKFSDCARKVMSLARQESQRLHGNEIGAEHILLGILGAETGVGFKTLESLKVDLEDLRQETRRLITPTEPAPMLLGQIPFSPRAKKSIELAAQASTLLGHGVIGTEHLLLGILMEGECVAAQVLQTRGMTLEKVRAKVVALVGSDKIEAK